MPNDGFKFEDVVPPEIDAFEIVSVEAKALAGEFKEKLGVLTVTVGHATPDKPFVVSVFPPKEKS